MPNSPNDMACFVELLQFFGLVVDTRIIVAIDEEPIPMTFSLTLSDQD